MNCTVTCGVWVIDSENSVCRHNVCLHVSRHCVKGSCCQALEGVVATPAYRWWCCTACRSLDTPWSHFAWEIATTVVKECKCSATVDYGFFCCVWGLLCVFGILAVSLQLCPASQSVVSAVIQSIYVFPHIVVEYNRFPLFWPNERTTITQVISQHVEAICMNCQREGLP